MTQRIYWLVFTILRLIATQGAVRHAPGPLPRH
jgi:hypothetical protein